MTDKKNAGDILMNIGKACGSCGCLCILIALFMPFLLMAWIFIAAMLSDT